MVHWVPVTGTSDNSDFRTAFRVKYVVQDAAYLEGGRAAGLAEGMKLVIRDLPNTGGVVAAGADVDAAGEVAELEVLSVAETSAVTEIHTPKRPVKVGDLAYLSSADQQALMLKNALSATRKYPPAISFTENDTLEDEARTEVPNRRFRRSTGRADASASTTWASSIIAARECRAVISAWWCARISPASTAPIGTSADTGGAAATTPLPVRRLCRT